jgi:hypothetical protein
MQTFAYLYRLICSNTIVKRHQFNCGDEFGARAAGWPFAVAGGIV